MFIINIRICVTIIVLHTIYKLYLVHLHYFLFRNMTLDTDFFLLQIYWNFNLNHVFEVYNMKTCDR